MADLEAWFKDIPIITRCYATLSFLTTAACALDLISPLALYFNWKLISVKGQVWRLFTNFFFFGQTFNLEFLFHMFFLVRYSRLLEEGSFRGRTADFLFMLLFGAFFMTLLAPFINLLFLSNSLTFMMVYIWGRRHQHFRMSFLGLFTFNAPYLPWVLLTLSLMLGYSPVADLVGIAVAHTYYFLEDVYPRVGHRRRLLRTPQFLKRLLDPPEPAPHED